MAEELGLSPRELGRVGVVAELAAGRMRQGRAAELLGLSVRQVKRLLRLYRCQGPSSLRSKRRGKPSNRAHDACLRLRVLDLAKTRYTDFGPTLLAEYLADQHAITLAPETLRQWLMAAGLHRAKKHRRALHHARSRRPRFGELVQIDGSPHAWFEDRGPRCTLIVFIDDATSYVVYARFVPAETTCDYFDGFGEHWRRHGMPLAYYSDRHSIFRVSHGTTAQPTQVERALSTLQIELICAHSPQAKGRVERVHQTLQDRLVKALRLAGINHLEAANAFLDGFLQQHNRRFAKSPLDPEDAHRPLTLDPAALRRLLALHHPRRLNTQGSVTFKRQALVLPRERFRRFAGRQCTVIEHREALELLVDDRPMPFAQFDLKLWRAHVEDRKSLDARLDRRPRVQPQQKPSARQRSFNSAAIEPARVAFRSAAPRA